MSQVDRMHFLSTLAWVVGLFIFWYGIVLCWVFPMCYRSLRSRVLVEYFIFKILVLLRIKKINKNKIISQKKFYTKSDILLGGPKDYLKSLVVRSEWKKYTVKYKCKKRMTEDLKENIIHNYTQDHPTSIHVVSDQNIDGKIENFENSINFKIKFQLIVPNMTSKPRNADFIVKKGILSNYPTHLFKDMAIIRLYSKYQLEVILKQYYNANPYYFINLNLGDNLKINDIISKWIINKTAEYYDGNSFDFMNSQESTSKVLEFMYNSKKIFKD